MTWDAESQKLFASAPAGQRMRGAISLSHPTFAKVYRFTTELEPFTAFDGAGVMVTYQPGPILVTPQGQEPSGRGAMPIRIVADPEVCRALVAASARGDEPIALEACSYTLTDPTPRQAIAVELTEIEANPDGGVVAGVAGMPQIDGMAFMRAVARVDEYPGLDRA